MEHVATAAKVNKALVYRYFGNKQKLFEAVIEDQLRSRIDVLESLPEDLGDMLTTWFKTTLSDKQFMRLILREALERGGDPVLKAKREEYYDRQIETLREFQRKGHITDRISPDALFCLLLCAVVGPAAFPQVMALSYRKKKPFEEAYSEALQELAELLKP